MPGAAVQVKSGRSSKLREEVMCRTSSRIFPPLPQKLQHPCPVSIHEAEPQPGHRRLLTMWGLS